MTRDDILKLDGEALNARVAIDVMGEEKPVYSHNHVNIIEPVFSEKGNWYCLPEWSRGDWCEWKPKRFSEDISAAWEVDRPGWMWDFYEFYAGLYVGLVDKEYGKFSLCVMWHEVEGDKARAYCLGRCRAALLAVLDVSV